MFKGSDRRVARWVAPVIIILLGLSFSLVPLFRGQFFFFFDNGIQHFPQTQFLVAALKHHTLPHWWPAVGAGSPVVAEGQAAHFHPIRLLLAMLVSAPAAFMGEVALYMALSGLGTYLFLRALRLHPLAASFGAFGFMFGSQFVIYVRSMALLRAGCLLPWVFWLGERYLRRRRKLDLLAMALVVGLMFLSGNPTFAVVAMLGAPFYIICRIALERRSLANKTALALRTLPAMATALLLGLALAAIQIVPTLKHVPYSERAGGLSVAYAANSLRSRFSDFIQPAFPYVKDLGDFTQGGEFNPAAIGGFYGGAVTLVAAALALWWSRRISGPTWALFLTMIFSATLALGGATPLYGLVFRLPFLNGLRFPVRYLFLSSFCFSCLGAIGIQKALALSRTHVSMRFRLLPFAAFSAAMAAAAAIVWHARPERTSDIVRSLILAAVGVLLMALLSAGRWRTICLTAAAVLLLGDLARFRSHWDYARTVSIEQTLRGTGAAGVLSADEDSFRVLSLKGVRFGHDLPQNMLEASAPPVWNLKTLDYSFSLGLGRYGKILRDIKSSLEKQPRSADDWLGFLGFLQTKYLIADRKTVLSGWEKVADIQDVSIWRNPRFETGEIVVGKVEPEGTGSELAEEIRARSIDFRTTAVMPATDIEKLASMEPGRTLVRAGRQEPDSMRFEVNAEHPSLLVVASNFYPGWSARVNGKSAPIYRANWVGMGVPVPAGESAVSLNFETPGWRAGAWISFAALLIWTGLAAMALRASRRDQRSHRG